MIKQVECKTALSPSSLPDLDYSLNPYRGCQHNCIYCYVPNVINIPRENWGKFVEIKRNIPLILSKELKRKKPGIIGISTVTDPYQPVEKKYKLTRYCLEQLLKHDFPVCIQTKSSLITRDIDIISKISDAEVMISIGTLNDKERKLLEPNSSSIKERLKTLKIFANNNIKTSVFFGPIYPTITTKEIPNIIDTFIQHNISEITIDNLHLKPGIWENIQKKLQNQPIIYKAFLTKIYGNKKNHYSELRQKIIEIGKERSIKIIDAF